MAEPVGPADSDASDPSAPSDPSDTADRPSSARARYRSHYARVRAALATYTGATSAPATPPVPAPDYVAGETKATLARRVDERALTMRRLIYALLIFQLFFGHVLFGWALGPAAGDDVNDLDALFLLLLVFGGGPIARTARTAAKHTIRPVPARDARTGDVLTTKEYARRIARYQARLANPGLLGSTDTDDLAGLSSLEPRYRNAYRIAASALDRFDAAGADAVSLARAEAIAAEARRVISAMSEGHGDPDRLLDLAAETVAFSEVLTEHAHYIESLIVFDPDALAAMPIGTGDPVTGSASTGLLGRLDNLDERERDVAESLSIPPRPAASTPPQESP